MQREATPLEVKCSAKLLYSSAAAASGRNMSPTKEKTDQNGHDDKGVVVAAQDAGLLEGAGCAIGICLLVYLYADLRLLSATGLTFTPLDRLQVDSDRTLLSGQIWAVLLAELRRQAALAKRETTGSSSNQHSDKHMTAPLMYPDETNSANRAAAATENSERNAMILFLEQMVARDMKPPDPQIWKDIQRGVKDHCPDSSIGACLIPNFGLKHTQLMLASMLQQARKQKSSSSANDSLRKEEKTDEEPDEVLDLLEEALESHESDAFKLLSRQFQDGSITREIFENETEFFWFQDEYCIKELVFGVGISRKTQSIIVFFRGTVTFDNILKDIDVRFVEVPNPIEEEYEGKVPSLELHRGIQSYLLRRRLDNSQTWCDRIIAKVIEVGEGELGDNYQLIVTGHSLGGALSTIFGFFASARADLCQQQPVIICSFASPMVGGHAFADAFRHQERCGRLRHARFSNGLDMVPHLPSNLKISKRGSNYTHVGMGLQLRRPPRRFFSLYRLLDVERYPKIEYERRRGFWSCLGHAYRQNVLLNMAPLCIGQFHSLPEYQERARYAVSFDPVLASTSLEELYKRHAKW